MIITGKDLIKRVLIDPASELGCDEFRVVSGYATAAMASHHIELLANIDKKIRMNVLVGMTSREGIVDVQHEGFKKLMEYYQDYFECSYFMQSLKPCHAKIYIWMKEGKPVKSFLGSANYTHNAFFNHQHEVLYECDSDIALEFFNSFSSNTICCNHCEVGYAVTIVNRKQYLARNARAEEAVGVLRDYTGLGHKTFSLLTRQGSPGGPGVRLNWGQRRGREKNQAYLHIPSHIAKKGFFPSRKQQFTVLTDDGKSMICVIAQDNEKAIQTTNNNSELGLYFRKRLGLEPGTFITTEDLIRYGRTDVTFCKIDNETYYMDFRVDHGEIMIGRC